MSGTEADRLPDRAGHAQRGRHGERHAGGLRRGGRDGDLQCGTGTGDRGLTGLFVRHGRGCAGRGRLGLRRCQFHAATISPLWGIVKRGNSTKKATNH